MGKVTYAPGIQYVNGALAKPKKQNGHKHGDYLIGTHRTAPTESNECTRIYIRKADRFAAVAAMVKARKGDLSQISADQDNFLAQKDTAGGKKTMRAYLWKVCGEQYDAQHQG